MAIRTDTVTGTITLTSGQTAFTVAGVNLVLRDHLPGDTIMRNGLVLVVETINPDGLGGTLRDVCPAGAAGSAVPLRMRYQPDGSRVPAASMELIQMLGDGTLAQIAALTGTDVMMYRDIASNWVTSAITAKTLALLGKSNNADILTEIGAQPAGNYQPAGDYQPLDADLTAIAALSTTAFGRELLTLAGAAELLIAAGAQPAGNYEPARTLVPQSEAEAGTATTIRAWNALRVAQAIAAQVPEIESGSNADGNFVKFPDGTLICTIASMPIVAATTSACWATWTLPHPMIDANYYVSPATFISSGDFTDTKRRGMPYRNTISPTVVEPGYFAPANTYDVDDTGTVTAQAIGRWKV